MVTCKYCGYEIEDMGDDIGWVETRSGDEGGRYDYCPESPADHIDDSKHEPKGA